MFNKKTFRNFALSALAISGFALGVHGTNVAHAADFTDAQKDSLNAMIKEFIINNPDVVMDSVQAYRIQQQEEAEKTAQEQLESQWPKITAASLPSVGPADADVTIVEFFDYNCGYCKRAIPDIQAVLEKDKNVRFVFKEMPILSESSSTAAKWALAAQKQDKYFEFHTALMEHRGGKDEATLTKIAEDLNLDVAQMKKDAGSTEIAEMIKTNMEISQEFGIRGTPAFIINGELRRGYLGPEGLEAAIKDARDSKG